MMNCKPVRTLMMVSQKLSSQDDTVLAADDASKYRSIVGDLQYLTLTRSDLSFPGNKVYQFVHQSTTIHWTTMK
jgi:hypothetical protein